MSKQDKYEYVYGFHPVRHILKNDIARIIELWVQPKSRDIQMQTLLSCAKAQNIAVQQAERATLDKLTNNGHHQGIVIRCKIRPIKTKETLEDIIEKLPRAFLLILDQVQDPHNLGACLRTADAAGVDAVIVPKNQACKLTAIVRTVACGAADTIPLIQIINLVNTINWLKTKDFWIVGTDMKNSGSTSVFDTKLSGPLAIILGSEGEGMRRLTKSNCDEIIHIPMLGKVESLNVSVATGICLYEVVRQQIAACNEQQI
ncbi:MAG: 23S rRNA (guanosine(2251)-2'-O)-methyltransferase RlmB [Thiomargarita sp.]|nr:23S rRNA (guanosine(2251)-2'-O)-methyltransferase RlmB [Thiomargarita sp.]